MATISIHLRSALKTDLDAVNRIIEAAVMTWNLPARVKRLSLSSYRYSELDFKHLNMVVAEDSEQNVIGVAAWEPAESKDLPAGKNALLLHGIYVQPQQHRRGIGHQLFQAAEQVAKENHFDGLLVKAQEDACGFFIAQGMDKLEAEDPARHYAHRFYKDV
jgi:GNAT superfamily N-acetyltransferase